MSLITFLTAVTEAQRLRKERAELLARVANAERRLEIEIASNRAREDELVNAVLEAAEIRSRAGSRDVVAPGRANGVAGGDTTTGPVLPEHGLSEAEVDGIAKQFIDQDREKGLEYTQADIVLLKDRIRSSPEEYTY